MGRSYLYSTATYAVSVNEAVVCTVSGRVTDTQTGESPALRKRSAAQVGTC